MRVRHKHDNLILINYTRTRYINNPGTLNVSHWPPKQYIIRKRPHFPFNACKSALNIHNTSQNGTLQINDGGHMNLPSYKQRQCPLRFRRREETNMILKAPSLEKKEYSSTPPLMII